MKIFNNVMILILCLFSFSYHSDSQESLKKIILNRQVMSEKTIDVPIKKVFSSNNAIVVLARPDTGAKGRIILFNNYGKELWQEEFTYVRQISLGDSSDKVIISQNLRPDGEQLNTCFNFRGDKLWEVWTKIPGLTQSDNGKYAITTRVNPDEFGGRFQLFNMETGKEIPVSIKKDYQHFYAQFLRNDIIAIVLQQMNYIRDQEVLREVKKLDKEKKYQEAKDLMRRTNKGYRLESESLDLVFYDAKTSSILKTYPLKSEHGKYFRTSPDQLQAIRTSDDGRYVAIIARDTSYELNVLMIFDDSGEFKQTITGFEYIYDVTFIKDKLVLVLDGSNMVLCDIEKGTKLWKKEIPKFYLQINSIVQIDEKQIQVQTSHQANPSFTNLFNISLNTGELLNTPTKDYEIVGSTGYLKLILSRSLNKIIFLK